MSGPSDWPAVAPRVFRDVTAAAGREVPWRVVIRTTELVWDGRARPGVEGVFGVEGGSPFRERETDFPEVVLELPHTWIHLDPPDGPDDVETGVAELAGRVQDEIIEEVHGAWPKCLVHEHPMRPASTGDGPATWECPTDEGVSVPIGQWDPAAAGWRPSPASPPVT